MTHTRLSATLYPSLRQLIQRDIGRLATTRPQVVTLASSYTKMSEDEVRRALTPGFEPHIGTTPRMQYEWTLPGAVIQIGELFAVQFETVMTKNKQKSDPDVARAAAAAVVLMESKLLHGFIHWGWGKKNAGHAEPPSRRNYNDFAWDFEEDFYGQPLNATTLNLRPKYIIIPGWP